MKGHSQETIKIILELDKKEAQWLKDVMENSLSYPKVESDEDKKFRETFWNILDTLLK